MQMFWCKTAKSRIVDYGLTNQWVRPQRAGYTGYMVSATQRTRILD